MVVLVMSFSSLSPANLIFDQNGQPCSLQYDDVYHTSDGGPEQSLHVFLGGNDLPNRWQGEKQFTVLETGFGLGLNFLMTWKTWNEDTHHSEKLHFISLEKHPFNAADLSKLYKSWPELDFYSHKLISAWPILTPGLHRLSFNNEQVMLTLGLGEGNELIREIEANVDAFFLDGFKPSRNPDLWSLNLFRQMRRLAQPDATIATYTVASSVRNNLKEAGFETHKTEGFGHKREMLKGKLCHHSKKPAIIQTPSFIRHAIVIGAGLAGASISEKLAARGWNVELVERHSQVAHEASGNSAGILMPLLSKDDNIASKLTRAGFLLTRAKAMEIESSGLNSGFNAGGVLLCAKNLEDELSLNSLITPFNWPEVYVRSASKKEAAELSGYPVPAGGLYFPLAGVMSPKQFCNALLDYHSDRIHRHFNCEATKLININGIWNIFDKENKVITAAPVVVMANAAEALAMGIEVPIKKIRGQISCLPASLIPAPRVALCNSGYVTPEINGYTYFGATYDNDMNQDTCFSSHQKNFSRLEQLIPDLIKPIPSADCFKGRVGFRAVSPDRLPLVGPVALTETITPGMKTEKIKREPGLYVMIGLGSRGLAWAPICAEILVSMLEHEPMPVEKKLIRSLDPARFLLRDAKQNQNQG